MRIGRFIAELRRRRVFRSGGLYLIGAWLVIQVASETVGPLGLPDWTMTFVVWAVIMGLPVALVLGWRYELGPSGLVKTIPRHGEPVDLTLNTSDYVIIVIVMLVVGIAAFSMIPRSTAPLVQDQSLQPSGGDLGVAVLPFLSEGEEQVDDAALIDGFVDDLRNQLNEMSGLWTVGRISSNAFKDATRDYPAIVAQLGVQVIVEGSFRRVGKELCASIDLIEGATGRQMQPTDRHCDSNLVANLVYLQQTVATHIAQRLLPNAERAAKSVVTHAQFESAQEARLLADSLYNRVRDEEIVDYDLLDRAIELYRDAIELDPTAAISHTRLASALLYRGNITEARGSLIDAWNRMVESDSSISELHATFGDYYYKVGSEEAGPSWRRAVEINPNNPDALEAYALWYWLNDDTRTPMEYFQRAIALDRLSLQRYARFGDFLGLAGRPEEAIELADEVHELFPNARGYRVIARINEVAGRLDEAIAWALEARALMQASDDSGEGPTLLDGYIAELYARIGDVESARAYEPNAGIGQLLLQQRYAELVEEAEIRMIEYPDELETRYWLAFGYNWAGRHEDAVSLLERTGLPGIVQGTTRESVSVQAMVDLIGGLYEIGRETQAENLAAEYVNRIERYIDTGGHRSWWPYMYQGCALAGVHRDEEALAKLEHVPDGSGLVLYPRLVDSICFRHLQGNERYRTVVARIDERMAAYRERLPETLREHGLTP